MTGVNSFSQYSGVYNIMTYGIKGLRIMSMIQLLQEAIYSPVYTVPLTRIPIRISSSVNVLTQILIRVSQPTSGWVSLIGGLDSSLEYGTGTWDWNVGLEHRKQKLLTYTAKNKRQLQLLHACM